MQAGCAKIGSKHNLRQLKQFLHFHLNITECEIETRLEISGEIRALRPLTLHKCEEQKLQT